MKNRIALILLAVCFVLGLNGTVFAAEPPNIHKGYTQMTGVVNINTAIVEELQMLPGIGDKTARLILDYRKTHGAFKSVDQLNSVKGIGPKKLKTIKPYCSLDGKSTLKVAR